MTDIVISEFMEQSAIDDLRREFDVVSAPDLYLDPAGLARATENARALIVRNRTRVDRELLQSCRRLEVIGRLGVGLDNIDTGACEAAGIRVFPATGANAVSVAEYAIAGVLMLMRGAYQSSARVLAGEWLRQELVGVEISGRVLGLIGFGATARAVADRGRGLGMRVMAYDPGVGPDDVAWSRHGARRRQLREVIADADAISVHVPLNDDTRHLIDADTISRMKPGAVLVNAARGGIVDEGALAAALREGRLRGAILDVFEDEPLPAGSALVGVPNLIVTPHIAGATEEAQYRVSRVTAENVARALRSAS